MEAIDWETNFYGDIQGVQNLPQKRRCKISTKIFCKISPKIFGKSAHFQALGAQNGTSSVRDIYSLRKKFKQNLSYLYYCLFKCFVSADIICFQNFQRFQVLYNFARHSWFDFKQTYKAQIITWVIFEKRKITFSSSQNRPNIALFFGTIYFYFPQ